MVFNGTYVCATPDSDPSILLNTYESCRGLRPYETPKLTTFGKVADPPTDDSSAILTLLELADFHLSATEKIPQPTTEEHMAVKARKRALQAAKDWLKRQLPL